MPLQHRGSHGVTTLHQVDENLHSRLGHLFEVLDEDRSGELDVHEILPALEAAGLSGAEAMLAFQSADVDGSGTLSLEEFQVSCGMCNERMNCIAPSPNTHNYPPPQSPPATEEGLLCLSCQNT